MVAAHRPPPIFRGGGLSLVGGGGASGTVVIPGGVGDLLLFLQFTAIWHFSCASSVNFDFMLKEIVNSIS